MLDVLLRTLSVSSGHEADSSGVFFENPRKHVCKPYNFSRSPRWRHCSGAALKPSERTLHETPLPYRPESSSQGPVSFAGAGRMSSVG